MRVPDPSRHRRLVDAARGGVRPAGADAISSDVRDSWARCARTLATRATAPLELGDPIDAWMASPIRRAAADLVDELATLATREDYVAAITDPHGRILWSENVAGTNAPGLVLETGRPAAVFATEHWCDNVRDWVCYAAPVRDPSGTVVGVLDLSSHWKRANPLALTFVTSMARLVERELERHAPVERAALRVQVLGSPRVAHHGTDVHVTNRQLEILVILAMHDGVRLDELHALLYGDRAVALATLKAEMSHLRGVLPDVIGSRPYRLAVPCELDVATVLDAVRHGDLERGMRHYRGALLPRSESPYVVDLRHHLDAVLADELLRAGAVAQLERYAELNPWDRRITERIVSHTRPRRTPR